MHDIKCRSCYILDLHFADKYIVQMGATEGQYSNETAKHPHTNMAKASLNMTVRTAAADYAKSNIDMNAVDTGWITDTMGMLQG